MSPAGVYPPFVNGSMAQKVPKYYSQLAPFAPLFDAGLPILMYHKIGPRPFGARLKGLYLSASLFENQLKELSLAGYRTVPFSENLEQPQLNNRRIILTFDDGFLNVLEYALPLLQKYRFQAIQYVVADLIGKANAWDLKVGEKAEPLMSHEQIKEWLQSGNEIGSHSCTHPHLSRLSLRDAQEEISGSKKRLEDMFQISIAHFCFPYGDWNEPLRDIVREAGYSTAVTTEFGVNGPESNPLSLRRIMARYPSRSLKTFAEKLSF
ncbi:MAG: Polysaccharide deacetylase [Verrucomicrobiales bacterium]|nr:Polysaccharide deacetylase [Verrucomicrobiales bacterium]MDB6130495.1 Polysaccharide deacetylase [Verrucomicrobiales bacterium]